MLVLKSKRKCTPFTSVTTVSVSVSIASMSVSIDSVAITARQRIATYVATC